jgi:hypothetical protein
MGYQELCQRLMVVAILGVVEQLGIIAQVTGDFPMVGAGRARPSSIRP